MVELAQYNRARAADFWVDQAILVSRRQMEQHPCRVLGFDIRGAILGHLNNLVGEAPPHRNHMVVLVVVTTVSRVHTDDVFAVVHRLFPNLQLDVGRIIDARFQLDHFEVEEITIDFITIRPIPDAFFFQLLQVLRNDAGLKERVTGLNKSLLGSPRLVLVKQCGFGPRRFRLPPDPRQLFSRDFVVIILPDVINDFLLFRVRRMQTVLQEARVFTGDHIGITSPPTNKKCPCR